MFSSPDTLIASHVDDLLVVSKTRDTADALAMLIERTVMLERKKRPTQALGMEIEITPKGIQLTQTQAILELAKTFGITTPTTTPHITDLSLDSCTVNEDPSEIKRYQSIVGSLLYIADHTRPDVSFLVAPLCQKTTNPAPHH